MVRKFVLTNSRGDSVSWLSTTLFASSPSGLGLAIDNTYSPYQSYFIKTKSQVSQGVMQTTILFSLIKSKTYQTFADFAEFLAYQPYTLEYDTDAGTWYRDCYLKEMPKSEAGIDSAGLLDEQITLEFINPWYNNKTAEYKSYEADPGLAVYGKGYFNQIQPRLPQIANSLNQLNLVKNSEFVQNLVTWNVNADTASLDTANKYNGSNSVKISESIPAWRTPLQSDKIILIAGQQISFGITAKIGTASSDGTGVIYNIRFYDESDTELLSVDDYVESNTIHDWKSYSHNGVIAPDGSVYARFSVWIANQIVSGNVAHPIVVIGNQMGTYEPGEQLRGDEFFVYLYGISEDLNSPFTDYAKVGMTYLAA
ncbi:phage distal tail protein domain-containing protein [Oenococcus sp.]|uniref:phage distal tail protein domain-containing protein n=1 Tax=Oenococcus sp. TaxID=1979414 RepID=UPI0039E99A8C